MYINYETMLSLPIFKGAKVISGSKGLHRTVRWIQVYEMAKPDESFRPRVLTGSFVLTSCIAMKDIKACLTEFLNGLAERHCAGLGIGIGYAVNELPQEVLALADQLEMPMVILPNDKKFVDITYQVSHIIFESYSTFRNAEEELLRRLLYFDYSPDILQKAISLGYRQEKAYQIIIVETEYCILQSQEDPMVWQQDQNIIMNMLRTTLMKEKTPLFLLQKNGRFLIMLPIMKPGENARKFLALQEQVKQSSQQITISVGLGTEFLDLSKVQNSVRTAEVCMQVIHQYEKKSCIMEYSGLGIERLFFMDSIKKELEEIIESRLSKLMAGENNQNDELLNTLKVYLDTGENIGESAELLFMHRNTMKYRIKRIQEILGTCLGDPEQRYELRTALRIYDFLKEKKH